MLCHRTWMHFNGGLWPRFVPSQKFRLWAPRPPAGSFHIPHSCGAAGRGGVLLLWPVWLSWAGQIPAGLVDSQGAGLAHRTKYILHDLDCPTYQQWRHLLAHRGGLWGDAGGCFVSHVGHGCLGRRQCGGARAFAGSPYFSGFCFNDFLGSEGGAVANSPSFFWFPFSTIFYGRGSRPVVRFSVFDHHVVNVIFFPASDDSFTWSDQRLLFPCGDQMITASLRFQVGDCFLGRNWDI